MITRAPAQAHDSGLRRALTLSAGGTAAARITGAVGGVFAARLLGPSGRGQLAVLVFVAVAGSMAAAAGIQFWVARQVAREGGVASVTRVVRAHVVVIMVTVPLVGLLVAAGLQQLASVGPAAVAATAAVATTAAVSLVLVALPNGLRAMGVVAGATVAAGAVYVVGTATLLAADERSVVLVLVAAALGNLVASGVSLVWARGAPRGDSPAMPTRQAYRGALAFGWAGGAGELVLLAMLRVDILIVAAFLPLRDVGLYAVATALAEVLWIVPDGVAQVVLPTTARNPGRAPTPRLLRISAVLTAAAGLGLVVVARPVINVVFGPAFAGAVDAVPLLVVACLAGGVWKIVGAEIVARGTTTPRLTDACLGLVVMVTVDLVAVPSFGIAGAALGSACGYGVAALVVYRAWKARVRT